MKKRKAAARKNLISRFLRVCVFAFVVYAAVYLVNMQVEIAAKRQTLDVMLQSVEKQRIVNKEYKRQLEEGMDENAIERIARENGYVWPEEKVFIDISGS